MTYRHDQAMEVIPYVPPQVEWFLLGGPADGDEANTLRLFFPKIKCMGFEPNKEMFQWQLSRFPDGVDRLLNVALWDRNEFMEEVEQYSHPRQAVYRPAIGRGDVVGMSLDRLDEIHGPFDNAFLWLDIEGSEVYALKGAHRLLSTGKILLVNLEEHCEGDTEERHVPGPLAGVMERYGFHEVHRWNGQRYATGCRYDIVYGRV